MVTKRVCLSFVSLVRSYHLGFRYFAFRSLSFVAYHCRNLVALSTTSFQFLLLSPPFQLSARERERERERGGGEAGITGAVIEPQSRAAAGQDTAV
jgi:hypothetical protein